MSDTQLDQVAEDIEKVVRFLYDRMDWLEARMVEGPHGDGKDFVLRLDGTYYEEGLEGWTSLPEMLAFWQAEVEGVKEALKRLTTGRLLDQ